MSEMAAAATVEALREHLNLRPARPATILQSYDQKHLQLSGNRHKNIGHKRFFSTLAASIASNYIIPPADLPRAFARPGYSQNRMRLGQSRQQKKEMTMRKMIYLVGTVAIAVVAAGYVWSHSTQIASPQRAMATAAAWMISPTEMMTHYKRPLPVEQFPETPIPPSEAIYRPQQWNAY